MKDPRIQIANMGILACVIFIVSTLAPVFSPFFDLPIKEQVVIGAILFVISSLLLAACLIYRSQVNSNKFR